MRTTLQTLFLFLFLTLISNTVFAQPANDNCADAVAIGEVSDYAFSTVMATTDGPNHPNDCISSGTTPDSVYNDVWYAYTPTFTGWAEWSLCGTADYDTKIVVYNSGATCPLSDGDLFECSEDGTGCAGATSEVVFPVTMGETYILRIGGYGDGSPGEEGTGTFYIIETTPPPPGPDNDDCPDAIEVMLGVDQSFNSTNATTDGPAHPSALCFAFGDDFVNADIWYYFTAPATTTIEWSTCNLITWDTRMAVYQAGATCPLSDGDLLVCNDDGSGCDNFTSYLTFPVEQGETYLLRLGGYLTSDNGVGTFDLNDIVPPEPPSNDVCTENPDTVSAIVSPDQADLGEGVNEGTTLYGTQDAGVPPCVNNGEFSDVWYKFNNEGYKNIEVRFLVVTDSSGFIFEIYDDCGTPALDTANGGTLTNTCFSILTGDDFVTDTIRGFPITPTDYYVRVSTRITFDDPGEFWFQLVSDEVVSNEEHFTIEKASIFPNPVNDIAIVDLDLKESAQTTFEVFNNLGQVVFREEKGNLLQGNQKFEIATSNFTSGIYFLKITAGQKQKILKFIKQ